MIMIRVTRLSDEQRGEDHEQHRTPTTIEAMKGCLYSAAPVCPRSPYERSWVHPALTSVNGMWRPRLTHTYLCIPPLRLSRNSPTSVSGPIHGSLTGRVRVRRPFGEEADPLQAPLSPESSTDNSKDADQGTWRRPDVFSPGMFQRRPRHQSLHSKRRKLLS
jgi:hypothetical protein